MSQSNTLESIRFSPKERNLFFPTVRKRVDQYFADNKISKTANTEMVMKTIILLSGYILPFVAIVTFRIEGLAGYALWAFIGVCTAGIGMSVMHDANHGAYSKKQSVNDWIGYSLNLLGGSTFNWKLQHNILHHTYTNIATHDEDIKDRAILKFSPHGKRKGIQKYQYLYAVVFYGIITLYWVLAKDLVQYIVFKKLGVNKNSPAENLQLLVRISLTKIIYLAVVIGLPIYLGMSVGFVIWGFLLMHFVAGIILTLVFQMAHTVEGTSHPVADENGVIENDWAIHQMNTTVNFSRDNAFLGWYLGGLNYQVEHHLFPKICHVHYPAIAQIVEQTAKEYGVPYLENKTFGLALSSHFRLLRQLGHLPSLNEAIG
jgi:linoleoyl-CoA desaturase